MKIKSAALDIEKLKTQDFDLNNNLNPEFLYGPDWKGSKIFVETYQDYDDNNYYTVQTFVLAQSFLETADDVLKAAKQAATVYNSTPIGIETFQEAIDFIPHNILKSHGLIAVTQQYVNADIEIDAIDYSTYLNEIDD